MEALELQAHTQDTHLRPNQDPSPTNHDRKCVCTPCCGGLYAAAAHGSDYKFVTARQLTVTELPGVLVVDPEVVLGVRLLLAKLFWTGQITLLPVTSQSSEFIIARGEANRLGKEADDGAPQRLRRLHVFPELLHDVCVR